MDDHLLAKIGQYALILNDEGKVLVLERARSKTWCLPGGRLSEGEEWDVALMRELLEETGFKYVDSQPFAVNVISDPYQTKYCVYFTVQIEDSSISLSAEHSGYRWLNKDEASGLDFEDEKIKDVVVRFLES